MRALKIGGIVLGALVVCIALALLSIHLFVNPNDYKGRIEQLVESATGRKLELQGPLRLSVFPWIALELGPASLGNPPGFPATPFLSVERAALRVKLLPLLSKRLEIGRVELDGLAVNLERNAAGLGNWQGLTGGPSPSTQAAPGGSLPALAELAGIEVRNASLDYGGLAADHVDLSVGRVAAGVAIPVRLALEVRPRRGAAPLPLHAQLTATADPATRRYRLASISLGGTMHATAGGPAVAWQLAAPAVEIDLAAQTLDASSVTAQLGAARLEASVHVTRILGSPSVTSTVRLDPLKLRDWLGRLGFTLPATRDPRALSSLAASGDLAYGGGAARLSRLVAKLDDSTLQGSAAVTDLATKATRFDLSIDHIDLDRYRAPPSAAAHSAASSPATPANPPTSLLESLRTNGQLAIGRATVDGVHLSHVSLGLAAGGGILHLAPIRAALYGGSDSGDITLDARSRTPRWTLDQSMQDIDVAQLLQDLAKTRRLAGRGNVTARLTAQGADAQTLLASLDGHVSANLVNGSVTGFDLWFEIERALALVEKRTLLSGSDSGRTTFSTFRASADLTNGIATTRDLDVVSQNLHVTGAGTANLVTNAIDYRVKARILTGSGAATAGALVDVPVTISGTLTSPKVRPDLSGLAESLFRQEIRKQKGRVEQDLLDRLKGLLK